MPAVEKKPKKQDKTELLAREVIWPEFDAKVYSPCFVDGAGNPGKGMTCQQAKDYLGWETEEEYAARIKGQLPDADESQLVFGPDAPFLVEDIGGSKVCCWSNWGNRPFDKTISDGYGQDILNLHWAGAISMPGETINGESISIGRTGRVISGAKRLVGFIKACQRWAKCPPDHPWRKNWPKEPVLETALFVGVSECEAVIQTVDNVQTRTEADTIYTGELYMDRDPQSRKELSRSLANAIEFLLKRTTVKKGGRVWDSINAVATHSTKNEFRERHPKLLQCVQHLWEENGGSSGKKGKDDEVTGRAISNLGLSPGKCAAMMYLMSAGTSDPDTYHTADPPSEKQLDFENWDKAAEFWVMLGKSKTLQAVREAFKVLVEGELGGRAEERYAVLAKAWLLFREGKKVTVEALALNYTEITRGEAKVTILDDFPDFGGIDSGPPAKGGTKDPDEMTLEESQAEKTRIKAENAKILKEKMESIKNSKRVRDAGKANTNGKAEPKSKTLADELNEVKAAHPADKLLIFKHAEGYKIYGTSDTTKASKVIKEKIVAHPALEHVITIPAKKIAEAIAALVKAGNKVALVEQVSGKSVVNDQAGGAKIVGSKS